MTRAEQLQQALEILGVRVQDLVADRSVPNLVLQLANGLAGVAESEVIAAEMELDTPDAQAEITAAERNVDVAAGWAQAPEQVRRTVRAWRAARLRNVLTRSVAEEADDPTLTAARDATSLALALLSYRSAAELSLISSGLEEVPESALDTARLLLIRIDETLRGLTA